MPMWYPVVFVLLFFVSINCEVYGTKRCKLNIKYVLDIEVFAPSVIANIVEIAEKSKSFPFSVFRFKFFYYLCSRLTFCGLVETIY